MSMRKIAAMSLFVTLLVSSLVLLSQTHAIATEGEDFVGGLVVSTDVDQGAYVEWGANGVVLWEAEDTADWSLPTVVWLTDDGLGQVALPDGSRRYAQVTLPESVVGVQQGDEPYEPVGPRLPLDVPVWTNFSYWAPMAAGSVDMEAALDPILAAYEGDRLSVSEYLLTEQRLVVLDYFRRWAKKKDIDLWQYLNAYRGYETNGEASHTLSDYRWEAFIGQAVGAKGHVRFAYAIGPGHPEATRWGGETLSLPDHREWTASVNRSLRRFSRLLNGTPITFTWDDNLVVGNFGTATMLVNNHHGDDTTTVAVDIDGCAVSSSGQHLVGQVELQPGDAIVQYRCVMRMMR